MKWDEISQKITKTGKDVTDKMKETSEIVRLRQKIASEKAHLDSVYEEIGLMYYENHEGEIAEELIPLFEKVTEIREAIEEFQANLDTLRKVKSCPVCGASMEADAIFCSKCGAKM